MEKETKSMIEAKTKLAKTLLEMFKDVGFVEYCECDDSGGWMEIDNVSFKFNDKREITETSFSL